MRRLAETSLTTERLGIVSGMDVSPPDLFLTDLLIYQEETCTADMNGDANLVDELAHLNASSRGCD
ncbi:MAG: hypothetical protein KJZ65_11155 [Phycisphaerales bacterium]|nr:hypothetical protein [Phycisphaerales bacterium]